jgi:hypothetical protein
MRIRFFENFSARTTPFRNQDVDSRGRSLPCSSQWDPYLQRKTLPTRLPDQEASVALPRFSVENLDVWIENELSFEVLTGIVAPVTLPAKSRRGTYTYCCSISYRPVRNGSFNRTEKQAAEMQVGPARGGSIRQSYAQSSSEPRCCPTQHLEPWYRAVACNVN